MEQQILFALCHPSLPHSTSPNTQADLKGVVDELAIRLDKSFQLTKDQKVRLQHFHLGTINVTIIYHYLIKVNIRRVCQEQIYKPTRTAFKDLHVDVLVRL